MATYQINLNKLANFRATFTVKNANNEILNCAYKLKTIDGELFMDLHINNAPVFYGRRCVCFSPMILGDNYGGNFFWIDKFESKMSIPKFDEFNDRFKLIFITEKNYLTELKKQ